MDNDDIIQVMGIRRWRNGQRASRKAAGAATEGVAGISAIAAAATATKLVAQPAFRAGKVKATLRAELANADKSGQLQRVLASFPKALQSIDKRSAIESCWLPIYTRFGKGKTVLGIQFLFQPLFENGDPSQVVWELRVRAKVISRTTYSEEAGVHWSARLVFGMASPFDDVLAHMPDHRPIRDPDRPAIDSKFREQRTSVKLLSGVEEHADALLQELRDIGQLPWTVGVFVRDAGGPPAEGASYGDCC